MQRTRGRQRKGGSRQVGPSSCAVASDTPEWPRAYEIETPAPFPRFRSCSPTFSAAPGQALGGQLLTQVPVRDRRLVALTTAPGHVLVQVGETS